MATMVETPTCQVTGCKRPQERTFSTDLGEWWDENTRIAESARSQTAHVCRLHFDAMVGGDIIDLGTGNSYMGLPKGRSSA